MQKDYKFTVPIFEIFNQQNNVVQALNHEAHLPP